MTNNLVLITSVIRTTTNHLSYTATRSIYNHTERYEQTKKTLTSIKEKIPNHKIFIIECSDLTAEETKFLKENSDYFLNLNDNPQIKQNVNSKSKSLGEGSMTISALEYIIKNNIEYDNLIKISGRYWLSDKFNYKYFANSNIIIKCIENNDMTNVFTSSTISTATNVFTALFKLPQAYIEPLRDFLIANLNQMFNCIGYEVLFANFIRNIATSNGVKIINISPIGLQGHVSVSNDFYDG